MPIGNKSLTFLQPFLLFPKTLLSPSLLSYYYAISIAKVLKRLIIPLNSWILLCSICFLTWTSLTFKFMIFSYFTSWDLITTFLMHPEFEKLTEDGITDRNVSKNWTKKLHFFPELLAFWLQLIFFALLTKYFFYLCSKRPSLPFFSLGSLYLSFDYKSLWCLIQRNYTLVFCPGKFMSNKYWTSLLPKKAFLLSGFKLHHCII